jgi:hypothetical protein
MRKTAVEMTSHGRSGKPKTTGFPPRPQLLEIANTAIPTFPQPRRGAEKVENEKHVSHFPACCFSVFKNQKGGPAADRFAPPSPGSFFNENMLCETLSDYALMS